MKILMFSGGLDSTILFYDLLAQGEKFQCAFINYGQKNFQYEFEAVNKICEAYGIALNYINVPTLFEHQQSSLLYTSTEKHTVQSDEVINRNATLACVAAANLPPKQKYTLLFAAHKTTAPYADTTRPFYVKLSKLLMISTNNRIDCDAPYIHLTKAKIAKKAYDLAITPEELNQSVSCYEGVGCGVCPACKARKEALKSIFNKK